MRSIFRRVFFISVFFMTCYSQCISAASNVDVVTGKITTVLNKKTISVFLLDKEGVILDIAGLDRNGNYKLDATVMDTPSYDNLVKLKLRIKDRKGTIKEINILNNIDEFLDKKVKIGTITFP